jgi:MFS family permease
LVRLSIGGYLTENWGWQYIFYVNLAPGAVMIAMLWFSLEAKPMQLKLLRQGDWPGVITMAIGLSALQTALEEGNKDDWFGSPFIVRLSVIAVVALALFLWVELTSKKPLLNLRLLARVTSVSEASPISCSALHCTVRYSSCRSIFHESRDTTPSRSGWCWPGPDCRNWC